LKKQKKKIVFEDFEYRNPIPFQLLRMRDRISKVRDQLAQLPDDDAEAIEKCQG